MILPWERWVAVGMGEKTTPKCPAFGMGQEQALRHHCRAAKKCLKDFFFWLFQPKNPNDQWNGFKIGIKLSLHTYLRVLAKTVNIFYFSLGDFLLSRESSVSWEGRIGRKLCITTVNLLRCIFIAPFIWSINSVRQKNDIIPQKHSEVKWLTTNHTDSNFMFGIVTWSKVCEGKTSWIYTRSAPGQ